MATFIERMLLEGSLGGLMLSLLQQNPGVETDRSGWESRRR